MTGYVGKLEPGETLQAGPYFEGPWRDFSRVPILEGQTQEFIAADVEYSIFVIEGRGVATVGAQTHTLTPGSALTVGYGAQLSLAAGTGGLDLFVTTVKVS